MHGSGVCRVRIARVPVFMARFFLMQKPVFTAFIVCAFLPQVPALPVSQVWKIQALPAFPARVPFSTVRGFLAQGPVLSASTALGVLAQGLTVQVTMLTTPDSPAQSPVFKARGFQVQLPESIHMCPAGLQVSMLLCRPGMAAQPDNGFALRATVLYVRRTAVPEVTGFLRTPDIPIMPDVRRYRQLLHRQQERAPERRSIRQHHAMMMPMPEPLPLVPKLQHIRRPRKIMMWLPVRYPHVTTTQ